MTEKLRNQEGHLRRRRRQSRNRHGKFVVAKIIDSAAMMAEGICWASTRIESLLVIGEKEGRPDACVAPVTARLVSAYF